MNVISLAVIPLAVISQHIRGKLFLRIYLKWKQEQQAFAVEILVMVAEPIFVLKTYRLQIFIQSS